ncbi:hypothetical protein M408DRAFT_324466 [Serendipita vermifera MAFF 305830]|uniref:Uncharacterized protein n=1 Tax=Serendipita vermifera MAFF 305830 TaxID=933852 RepID=A0A0C2XMY7_SERVB|nr:hypothetical protein M408DRAFT_324466 [Serendipita vermifera MAFF 305830]
METSLPPWATIMAGTLVLPLPSPTTRPSALNITTSIISRTFSTVTSRVSTHPASTWASTTTLARLVASAFPSLLARRYPLCSVQIPSVHCSIFPVPLSLHLFISPQPTSSYDPYPAVSHIHTFIHDITQYQRSRLLCAQASEHLSNPTRSPSRFTPAHTPRLVL